MQKTSIDCTLFQKLLYLCNVLNVMSMPTKNIFAGFGLRSEFVNLIYNELMKREFCQLCRRTSLVLWEAKRLLQ